MKDKTFGTIVCLFISLGCLLALSKGEIKEGDARSIINMCDERLKENTLGIIKGTITKIVRGSWQAQVYLQNGTCQSIVRMEYKHLKMTPNVGSNIQVPVKYSGVGMFQSVGGSKLTSGILDNEGKLTDDLVTDTITIRNRIPWQNNFFWYNNADNQDVCLKFTDGQRNEVRPGKVKVTFDKNTGNILEIVRL